MRTLFLVGAALLPAAVLCIYIFKKDRVEKEPTLLLIRLFLFGVLCCFPAAYAEGFAFDIIDKIFAPFALPTASGLPAFPMGIFRIYNAVKYFIGVALIEEGCKWIALTYVTRKDENFNCLFDGVIYAVFVSLGFAAYENIFYVLEYGFGNAVSRAILSVPGHMFFGVLMGYYYSFWHITDKARMVEQHYKDLGRINKNTTEFSSVRYIVLSIVMPVIAHGIYDYCCTLGTITTMLAFYGFIVFLYIYCFGKINKMSKADGMDNKYVAYMMAKKYPTLF